MKITYNKSCYKHILFYAYILDDVHIYIYIYINIYIYLAWPDSQKKYLAWPSWRNFLVSPLGESAYGTCGRHA